MHNRQRHQQQVHDFLQKQFSIREWTLSLPEGSGNETYFADENGRGYFVKVGAAVERYLVAAALGLTPPILAAGELESGASILVQPLVPGRKPSRKDYRDQLEKVAKIICEMHNHPRIKETLPPAAQDLYKDAGITALTHLRRTWKRYKERVPNVAAFVDKSLDDLAAQIDLFSGNGLVASHNDICNANWLFASDGKIYLVDFDSMSLDDPALDLGALLWWYYPPELRARFLEIAGYRSDDELKFRMQVRMAMHCLYITLPRESSFDCFQPAHYSERLCDFRAILAGKENPQGYED